MGTVSGTIHNINALDEIDSQRAQANVQARYDGIFNELEAGGAPPARTREHPDVYERRLLTTLASEVDRINSKRAVDAGRNLDKGEQDIRRWATSGDMMRVDGIIMRNLARPAMVAAAEQLVADPDQGSFRNPSSHAP